jgi:hypothetical protein
MFVTRFGGAMVQKMPSMNILSQMYCFEVGFQNKNHLAVFKIVRFPSNAPQNCD